MIKKVSEAYDAYIAELRRYKKWTDEMKAKNDVGIRPTTLAPLSTWDNSDYQRVLSWNGQIKAIEAVLGLTEAEIKIACNKVGIVKV